MASKSMTTHLLALDATAFKAATTHPFLRLAGTNSLPSPLLLTWLLQDRLYALSYTNFIGALLAKVPIPTSPDRTSTLEWRIADLLIDALANIRREVGMFEDILRTEFGWGSEARDRARATVQTRTYLDLFAGASKAEASLMVGLTALWATEKCYLEAWRFARTQGGAEDGGVLGGMLIPNWTSEEFIAFVQRIEGLVDELAEKEGGNARDLEACEDVWMQVLWAEERFWPDVKGVV